jgi:hypothetical protein
MEAAVAQLRAARESLAVEFSWEPGYRADLALTLGDYAEALKIGNRLRESAAQAKRAVIVAEALVEEFPDLQQKSPADYTITAGSQGITKVTRENMVVREGLNLVLDLTMMVGPVSNVRASELSWKHDVESR